jgi:Na+/phosphate symporter
MPYIKQRKLINKAQKKREQQKYVVLLSNQTVIVGSEWDAMKRAVKTRKVILEMLPTYKRINDQVTSLTKLIESREPNK